MAKSNVSRWMSGSSLKKVANDLCPVILLMGYGYLIYCYCYRLCWTEIWLKLNDKATSIAFLVIFNVLFAFALYLWMSILVVGPGKVDVKIPPYDLSRYLGSQHDNRDLIEPPEWFISDANGLPSWCTHCESIKIFRSHHSSSSHHCVPVFDHYCFYIGGIIGALNYKLFMMFLVTMVSSFSFMFVTTMVFVPRIQDYKSVSGDLIINPNLILLLIGSGFWMCMTSALLCSHVLLISKNRTTVEVLQLAGLSKKERVARFVNFRDPDNHERRIVMTIDTNERVYDKGIYNNICELFGTSGISLLLPMNLHNKSAFCDISHCKSPTDIEELIEIENNLLSEKFKSRILVRLAQGEGWVFGSQSGKNV